MLWIPVTVAAAAFQVARNAAQRNLMGGAGPWGATLVRFLFGLPFSLLFTLIAWLVAKKVSPHFTPAYFGYSLSGAVTQVAATAALLVSMRRAGFAVGTAVQQSALPLSGILGWIVFHDALSGRAWFGVFAATVGLVALTWRRGRAPIEGEAERPLSGAAYGLLSGLLFGFSLNAYRHAGLTLEPDHPVFAAVATVSVTQAAQSLVLGGYLALRAPAALEAVLRGWRGSLLAGFCGACASGGWLYALALAPAAPVRAVGVVEAPIAAAAGRRLFAERLPPEKLAAGALVAAGVVLTAWG